MPEYKPRRLGDVFGSTTPTTANVPVVSVKDAQPLREILTVHRLIPYSGNGSTAALTAFNTIYFIPLLPLVTDYALDYGRLRVGTASAGNYGRCAFYSYASGVLTKIEGSEIGVLTTSGSTVNTVATSFTLSRQTQYFWASVVSSLTPTFQVFSMSDSAPRPTPLYTKTMSGVATTRLPDEVSLSSCATNYANNWVTALAPFYYSKNMVNIV